MYLGTTSRFFSVLYLGIVFKNSRILLDIPRTSPKFFKHPLNKDLGQVLDISRSILGFRDGYTLDKNPRTESILCPSAIPLYIPESCQAFGTVYYNYRYLIFNTRTVQLLLEIRTILFLLQ